MDLRREWLKFWGALLLLIILSVAIVIKISEPKNQHSCGNYRQDKTVTINGQHLEAEVAKSEQAREQGLSGRPCIGPNEGMLFVFDRPGHYYFWMKDMKFPIDIIWIGTDKKAVAIERDVKPSSYPNKYLNKDTLALYVLEIPANRSNSLGLKLGSGVNF